ncbi:MAG TPA: UDP-glucose/GDP-mannose dehydrogenase family protein [Candidatus Limnocylindrales bacterium]
MRATILGLGYVGLVTAAGLAEREHDVVGVDVDERRVRTLANGIVPIHEPGLQSLVESGLASGRLRFTTDAQAAVSAAQIVIVAVGTHDGHGGWQTRTMVDTLAGIVEHMADDATLVIRSTLPPEFVARLEIIVSQLRADVGRRPIPVLLNPEFTREGRAVRDFLEPDRVVIGVAIDPGGRGVNALTRLYRGVQAPVLRMSAIEACLSKLGANLFLATKISFANEMALLADAFGADVTEVTRGMSYDTRIGGAFLRAGIGFGGSCLPNQVTMTVRAARAVGIEMPLIAAVGEVNARQRSMFVARIASLVGDLRQARVALLGLAFKPDTDDLRDAPSLDIARELIEAGATVVAYDPVPSAMEHAAALVPGLRLAADVRNVLLGADAAGIVTEWPAFREIAWSDVRHLMRRAIVVDGRNALDPAAVAAADFIYASFGRDVVAHAPRPAAEPIVPDVGVVSLPLSAVPD